MRTIQQYLNENEPKERIKIFIEGIKIGEIGGNTLIIEGYNKLESIYVSDLPNLTKLTIKDCKELANLELSLDNHLEISLVGEFPKLCNFKTSNIQPKPTIIYQNKEKEGFCWGCALNAITIIGLVVLTWIIVKLSSKINELRKFIKELQKRLK